MTVFAIGNVAIEGDLILSPMVGYTDLPYRRICRQMGSALSYVPLVIDDVVNHHARHGLPMTDIAPDEHPLAIQLLSKDPERLARASGHLMALSPEIIDLNLGCPARRVVGHGRGAALLREPTKIAMMITRLVKAVPVPITAKIRLGWDASKRNYLDIVRVLEDSGITAIAVHGRTRDQGYGGRADWEAIAHIRQMARVPIMANGDVRTVADIDAIKATTGCQVVLIGRGAIGNPWIFARRDPTDVSYPERLKMIERHLADMVAHYGPDVGLVKFRKHAARYIQHLDSATELRRRVMLCETPEALLDALRNWGSG